jgi:fructose-bisphosphate aldolase, class II
MPKLKQTLDALNERFPESALGAFNVDDMIGMQAVMQAAMKTRQPCIMMITPSSLPFLGMHFAREMFQAARMTSDVPLYLMLDHSSSIETCGQAIDNGFSLVMFDGSALPFEENVRCTREVVRMAHARGVLVEAEIGKVPGREEQVVSAGPGTLLTDPREAKEFWDQTGVDLLAISFGTIHGITATEPKLDFEVIRATRTLTDAPLVMHGGTGVADADVRKAIASGVKKVNIGSELRHVYATALRNTIAQQEMEIDPKKILVPSRDAVQKAVEARLAVFATPRMEQLA